MLVRRNCLPSREHRVLKCKNNLEFMRAVVHEHERLQKLRAVEMRLAGDNTFVKFNNETAELATQLKRGLDADFVAEKRCQQLRINEESLRTLQRQLRNAANVDMLLQQKKEHEEMQQEKQRKKCEEKIKAQKLCQHNRALQLEEENEERHRKLAYRDTLFEQISEKHTVALEQLRQKQQARLEMDEFTRRYKEEQQMELLAKQKRKEIAKLEQDQFKRMQEEAKRNAETQKRNEAEEFARLQREQEHRKLQQELEKQRKLHERELRSQFVGEKVYAKEKAKSNFEQEMQELLIGEAAAREDVKYAREVEKRVEARKQLRYELNRDRIYVPQYRQKLAQERENKYLKEWMASLAEYDKCDQLALAKRQQKNWDIGRELKQFSDRKLSSRLGEVRKKEQQLELEKQQGRKHLEMVEKERMKILHQQPPSILRYMPPNALSEDDCKELGLPPPWELRRM